ncbi:glycosyltransferase family 2 protein [Desulfosporosinus sp.]|uniref:glycosyltransferase family 2 protein n=1 Tax=Desulfosporosinus sp. TaxID=157907 RepID=UPI0025BBD710|nr:glycosyltransferase family 2 protein [Desulfosporosinus sp.]MBC2721493.1 glycosyltransferase family 2 protein [Desulfosporosinus sp.]MBC2726368.1 glycosyltransferase family 2 protein [Desulfosporosinus sp.]
MKHPIVSVIIPTYNVQDYIRQAIHSALDQTLQDLEVIVIDDASTDQTVEIIQSINDSRVHLTISPENHGPSYSRNLAIKRATGEWIALLDGDDWWEKDRLERMLKAAEAHQADIVADDIRNFVEGETNPWNETHLGKLKFELPKWSVSAVDVIQYDLGPLKPLTRRDFLLRKGLHYHEDITYGEDFVLLLECLLHGATMLIIPDPLYIRRAWPNSLTAHRQRSTECLIKLTETLLSKMKAKEQEYLMIEICPEVINALEKRLKKQSDSYLYHQLTEPFKKGNPLQAACQMLGLMLRKPRSVAIMAEKVPDILDYRVLRHLKRPTGGKDLGIPDEYQTDNNPDESREWS